MLLSISDIPGTQSSTYIALTVRLIIMPSNEWIEKAGFGSEAKSGFLCNNVEKGPFRFQFFQSSDPIHK